MNIKKHIFLASTGVDYEFTGADDSVTFSPTADVVLDGIDTFKTGKGIVISGLHKFFIRRARISSPKAVGLDAGAETAATIVFKLCKIVEGVVSGDPYAEFTITFSKWNEWEEKSVIVEPINVSDGTEFRPCQFVIAETGTEFNVDDFNIQSDYVGTEFTPSVELEIIDGTILDSVTGEVV